MDLKSSGGPADALPGYLPWFDVPGRKSADLSTVKPALKTTSRESKVETLKP